MLDKTPTAADAAMEYLEEHRPGGPWILTASDPPPANIRFGNGPTTTITARNSDEVCAFIDEHDGKRPIEFLPNSARPAMISKPSTGDVTRVEYLPARFTIDENTKDFVALRSRSVAQPPTAIIESGDCLYALWRLVTPINDPARMADVENRTEALAKKLGGFGVSIARTVPLPGTTYNGRTVKTTGFNRARYALEDFPALLRPNRRSPPRHLAGSTHKEFRNAAGYINPTTSGSSCRSPSRPAASEKARS